MTLWNRITTFFQKHIRWSLKGKMGTSERSAPLISHSPGSRNASPAKTLQETNMVLQAELKASWKLFYLIYKFALALIFIGYFLLFISVVTTGLTSLSTFGVICQFFGVISYVCLTGRTYLLNRHLLNKIKAKNHEFLDLANRVNKSKDKVLTNTRTGTQKSPVRSLFGTDLSTQRHPVTSEIETSFSPSTGQVLAPSEVQSPIRSQQLGASPARSQQRKVVSEVSTTQLSSETSVKTRLRERQSYKVNEAAISHATNTGQIRVECEVHPVPSRSSGRDERVGENDPSSRMAQLDTINEGDSGSTSRLLPPSTTGRIVPSRSGATGRDAGPSTARDVQRPSTARDDFGLIVREEENDLFFPPNVTVQPEHGFTDFTPFGFYDDREKSYRSKCNLQ